MEYLQPVRTLVTAGEGSEPVCGQNRTGFYLGISPDHQLVGELRHVVTFLHKLVWYVHRLPRT